MPTIARLSIAPVKSAALQHPGQIDIQPGGIVGDRQFALIDGEGRRVSATKLAALVPLQASFDALAERLVLRFPDGSTIEGSTAADGSETLVASLWDVESPATTLDPRFDAELSARLAMPVRLVHISQLTPGPRAVTLIAAATVADLAERMHLAPEELDIDRFRMSVVLDDAPRWVEDEWEGRQVRLGEAVVEVNRSVTRCVVTCWDPATGLQDVDTLGPLGTYRKPPDGKLALGRYARVIKPGIARLGDTVEPL